MNILILGYGYSGYYCAKLLLEEGHNVFAVSRSYPKEYQLSKVIHIKTDVRYLSIPIKPDAVLYCVPPLRNGVVDNLLFETLKELKARKLISNIVYWGSSGVYGDHKGKWVDEESSCNVNFDIQRRRLDAESQIQKFTQDSQVNYTIMRVAGIYGPNRLPITNKPVIKIDQAPYSNMVYINDAAKIAVSALINDKSVGKINISDGCPIKMGTLQRLISEQKGINIIEHDYNKIMQASNPMRQYFLSSSKRLSNKKSLKIFPNIKYSNLNDKVFEILNTQKINCSIKIIH